jgi:hypothetical protein
MHDGDAGIHETVSRPHRALAEAYDRWVATRSEFDFELLLATLYEQWDGLTLGTTASSTFTALWTQFPLLADQHDFWDAVDALSYPDFDAFDDEERAKRKVSTRVARAVGMVLVVALLAYFVVPYVTISSTNKHREQPAGGRPRPIPVTPEHQSSPKFPV